MQQKFIELDVVKMQSFSSKGKETLEPVEVDLKVIVNTRYIHSVLKGINGFFVVSVTENYSTVNYYITISCYREIKEILLKL